ncbi:N-acetylglucosamine-6-phosphate deacetylase [compost metagenome]
MVNKGGVSLVEAVQMMTINPARLLGLDHKIGAIATGMEADIVLFDDDVVIHHSFVAGELRYSK